MLLVYKTINEKLEHNKEKVNNKVLENREQLPETPEKVCVENKQKQIL